MYSQSLANSGKYLSVTFDDLGFLLIITDRLNVSDCLVRADIFMQEMHADDTELLLSLSRMNSSSEMCEGFQNCSRSVLLGKILNHFSSVRIRRPNQKQPENKNE